MSVNSFSGQPAIPASYGTSAGKNAVINGGFDIWQRGATSSTITGFSKTYVTDRWWALSAGTGSFYLTRQATSDTTNLPNIQYCARVQRTAGTTNTNAQQITNPFETVNSIPFAGKIVTLSFYARAGANFSSTSNTLAYQVLTGTGTDESQFGGYTGQASPINQTATLTTTWQRFTYTGTIATTATEMAIVFTNTPTGTAGAADYFEVTGVQLELGATATTFSRAAGNIQGELAACQSYYWRNSAPGVYGSYGAGYGASTTVTEYIIATPVTMRVAPTSVDYANLGASIYGSGPVAATSVTLSSTETTQNSAVVLGNHASGITQYRPYFLANNNSASGYIGFSAEL
jgi:hypothetical protein